jgi:hypothetical protein
VNSQDADGLLALSDANIEITGPRGAAYGHQLLRDWLGRAGLSLTTLRTFARGDTVVVAQRGVWRSIETGKVQGEADVASSFHVVSGRVTQFARYDDLETALAQAGLGQADEIEIRRNDP